MWAISLVFPNARSLKHSVSIFEGDFKVLVVGWVPQVMSTRPRVSVSESLAFRWGFGGCTAKSPNVLRAVSWSCAINVSIEFTNQTR